MPLNIRIRALSDLVLFMASIVSLWLDLQERGEFPFMTEQQGWFLTFSLCIFWICLLAVLSEMMLQVWRWVHIRLTDVLVTLLISAARWVRMMYSNVQTAFKTGPRRCCQDGTPYGLSAFRMLPPKVVDSFYHVSIIFHWAASHWDEIAWLARDNIWLMVKELRRPAQHGTCETIYLVKHTNTA